MKIFLSYSSQDAAYAQTAAELLRKLSHEVLTAQTTWTEALQGIAQSSLFIFIASQQSLDSQTRRLEYTFAHDLHKRILTVVVDANVVDELPEALTSIPPILLAADSNLGLLLISAIRQLPPARYASSLPPPYPNLVTALAPLYAQAANPPSRSDEQIRLIHNLADLLERKETAEQARSSLQQLRTNPKLLSAASELLEQALNNHATGEKSARSGMWSGLRLLVIIIILLITLIAIGLFLTLNRQLFPPQPTPSPTIAISTLAFTSTPTVTFTLTPTASFTLTSTPSRTPTVTLTNTASPTVTATATNISTRTPSPTVTVTVTSTPIITLTPTATTTPTASPTATVNPTATEQPIFTPMMYVGITVEDTSSGVRIITLSDSAAAAGVMAGDYVDGVDFIRVTTKVEFLQAMSAKEPYSRANLRLHRGDQTLFILVTLGAFDFTSVSPTATP